MRPLTWRQSLKGETIRKVSGYIAILDNEHVELYPIVRAIVELIIIDFVYSAIRLSDAEKDEIVSGVLSYVMAYYGRKISLTGLAHCFDLCSKHEFPFDGVVFSYTVRGINGLIKTYSDTLALKQKQFNEKKKNSNQKPIKFRRYEPKKPKKIFNPWTYKSIENYCDSTNQDYKTLMNELEQRWQEEYESDVDNKVFGFKIFKEIKIQHFLSSVSQVKT